MNADAMTYAFDIDESRPGRPRYTWSVVGPAGGVHIWAQTNDPAFAERWGDRFIGGVECHWPVAADHSDHPVCWLLNGPCRHDGTSLYFGEQIAPMLSPKNIASESIAEYMKAELYDWYQSRIASKGGDA